MKKLITLALAAISFAACNPNEPTAKQYFTLWNHKTLHRKFTWGVPAILIAQMAIVGVDIFTSLLHI